MKKPKVSIIIRTKNEERWITPCLQSIFRQSYKNFEIIIVDNQSNDKTLDKAKQFKINKILHIKDYLPGKALNLGIENSTGKHIVCLSAHAIPINSNWLKFLVNAIEENPKFAGVYGRQEPMSFSTDSDKRDMFIVFGLDRKIQTNDSFFHNANSIIRKKVWENTKFDSKVSNIEDRLWAQKILKKRYKILYEPKASVYHFHGIHQDGNIKRLTNVVNIIETSNKKYKPGKIDPKRQKIIAIIPIRGVLKKISKKWLLEYTIKAAKKSKFVSDIYVSTDLQSTAKVAKSLGAKCPFLRPEKLSESSVNLDNVQKYSLQEIEKKGIFPDLIVHLEETFPFRTSELIDEMIVRLLEDGHDTLIAAKKEFGSIWHENERNELNRIDMGDIPRDLKEKNLVGVKGLCCVTHPEFIRRGKLFGKKIGLFEYKNQISGFEVRGKNNMQLASKIIK